ncbi:hypothetical protein BN7_3109 [Wickerhamomyces ciferrii]|uniref:Dystroglycan-type cadherin-like domain-containing protein n=1 Tax=Wickerhamomyces ciferrii (strain ATCC 14091 / BCRC 22168 / CBS 111 / JCM 3599 / NBRC 0793 / NRRL Y-1031 F-60-10) TaxID=1206466 RepID=K0KMW3_WICCF|nr:uncharacterized protein BN7_3109 [Wickerhamomyces ciferrii]CCH43557.1 hypothetical protein BN7_3109 [Wickerhamomyces ciferrii]
MSMIRAAPREGFPFDEQLPTVARVDSDYWYQLSNETFISSTGEVTYSIENQPSWLEFDPTSRILSGTPSEDDATEAAKFTLVGEDGDSTISKEYSIVVSKNKGPVPSDNYTVLSQLSDFGQTNGQNGLVLSPGKIFNVSFDTKTFDSDDTVKAYYGRSADRSSLPNWLFFDSGNLRFSGVAPSVNSEIAPGFKYSFILIATDYTGNAGGWIEFDIVVGYHDLTTSVKGVTHVNGSAGDDLDFDIPLDDVYQDGETITTNNISNVQLSGAPDWLTLDNYTLVGTVPEDYESSNDTFNVTIWDYYSNQVALYFQIESIDSLFSVDSFRDANATRGSYFQYYFTQSQFTDFDSTNITVDAEDADWLSFHRSNLTINGETPDDFDETKITVQASKSGTSDELSFKVRGQDSLTKSSSSSSRSSSTSSSSSSPSGSSTVSSSTVSQTASSENGPISKSKSNNNKKALAIGLGVGIPLFLIILAAVIVFLCCFRRRKNNKSDEEDSQSSPKISKPILGNPANGPNRSPTTNNAAGVSPFGDNGSSDYEVEGAMDEKNEPHRLGALNVLKLDGKEMYEDESSHSSISKAASFESIHDDTHSSLYQDALQSHSSDMLMGAGAVGAAAAGAGAYAVTNRNSHHDNETLPKKSWRQTIDSKINRESLNSLATVSTNELFSIRLAEDDEIRKDPRKSNLGFRDSAFLGSTASSILTRDDSGNIQRLDSDGNIVDLKNNGNNGSNNPFRHSKGGSLDVLKEEATPHQLHSTSFPTQQSYNQPQQQGQLHPNHKATNSSLVQDTSFTSTNTQSTGEEFYPVETSNGVEWKQNAKNKFTFENGSVQNLNDTTSSSNYINTKARLMDFTNKARAESTSNDVSHSTYETAEFESP